LSSHLFRDGLVDRVRQVPPDVFPECIMISLRRAGRALHGDVYNRSDGGGRA
jgi:hypothetical protein